MWVGLGAGLLWGPAAREAAAQSVNVCDRTVQVRDAIVAASGGDNCAQLTVRDMREITALDLGDQDIATLRADDFGGLVRLKSLDLSDNLLTSLPRGVFDELYLLEILRLDGNLLEGLPVGIFDQLFLLEDLSLDDNRFTSLPEGLFDELSRLDGFQASGDPPDNSGPHARLLRFLDRHSITSVEEFINALPALHQERFVMVYRSEALAPEAITEEHPRIIAWGADGRFVFSWPTNPEMPHPFGESVEFLQQADDRTWIAGAIDFSNPTPEIAQPAVCQSCHGSLSKPLWGGYFRWGGTEGSYEPDELLANAENNYRAAYSNNPRITPLDFSASVFFYGYKRYFEESSPAHPYTGPVEEASLVLALRHAEVLFERLKAREDYGEFAENTVCSSDAGGDAQRSFMDAYDHTIGVFANELRSVGSAVGSWLSGATYPNYNYQDAHFGEILVFLIVHDLWETHAAVRRLYRSVSNADLRDGERGGARRAEDHLVYPVGEATAEDELIQLYRLHFGYGGRAAIAAIAAAQPYYGEGAFTARFGEGHLWTMLPRVCATLRGAGWEITPGPFSVPEGETAVATLSVSEEAATAELSWSLPSGTSPDGAHFEMTAEGALVFGAPKDFESRDDANGDGTYEVSVQVSDGARSASADISVTLSNRNEAPVADAGADQEDVEGGATVALSGTGTDPDADDTLTYGWTQTGGTTVTLSAASAAATSFTAPANLSQDETLRFALRVTDAAGLYAEDEVAVTVRGSRNEAPVADAGADQEDVEGGATVALSGTGTDPDADDTLTCGWTQTGGTTVTLSAASSFTAPANLSQDETLRFTLRVTDAAGLYAEDEVAVTVRGSRNEAPVADAGGGDELHGARESVAGRDVAVRAAGDGRGRVVCRRRGGGHGPGVDAAHRVDRGSAGEARREQHLHFRASLQRRGVPELRHGEGLGLRGDRGPGNERGAPVAAVEPELVYPCATGFGRRCGTGVAGGPRLRCLGRHLHGERHAALERADDHRSGASGDAAHGPGRGRAGGARREQRLHFRASLQRRSVPELRDGEGLGLPGDRGPGNERGAPVAAVEPELVYPCATGVGRRCGTGVAGGPRLRCLGRHLHGERQVALERVDDRRFGA